MCFSTFFFFCTNLFEKSCIKIEKWGNDKVESVFETSGTVLIVHLPVDLDHPVSDDIRRESDRIIGRQYIKNMVSLSYIYPPVLFYLSVLYFSPHLHLHKPPLFYPP